MKSLGNNECIIGHQIDPYISIALMYQNEIVGWIIAIRVDRQTVQYHSAYVNAGHRLHGQSLHLIAASMQRLKDSGTPNAQAEISLKNIEIVKLIRRKLIKHIDESTYSMQSTFTT